MKNTGLHFKQERTKIYDDKRKDAYRSTEKHPDPTICNDCGSLYTNGRWTWNDLPEHASHAVCPACQRIRDKYPAGIIEIWGPFFEDHRSEIMNMIQNIKNKEISEHPLERLITITEEEDKIILTTTGIHLARRIGDSLFRAYEGELNYNYDENLIRVYWER